MMCTGHQYISPDASNDNQTSILKTLSSVGNLYNFTDPNCYPECSSAPYYVYFKLFIYVFQLIATSLSRHFDTKTGPSDL